VTRTRRSTAVATALLGVVVAELLIAIICGILSGLSAARLDQELVFTNTGLGLILAVAGWPIAAYRPGNKVGWLLLGGGVAYASTGAGIPLLACVANAGWAAEPFWRAVATVVSGGWSWAITVFVPLALLHFPDGRLPSRRWRWLAVLAWVDGVLFYLLGTVSGFTADVGVRGYFVLGPAEQSRYGWLFVVVTVPIVVIYVAVMVSLLGRFRRGDEQTRRQLLWVLLALIVVVVVFALDPVLPDSDLSIAVTALIPLAILVAIFRHGLLDIRLVFARSVLYLLLTGAAIGAYVALVAAIGQILTTAALGRSLAATLLVALAFNPVRVWLQNRVDRLVYGARRDPVRAMAEVGARLGETTSRDGLDGVLAALCGVMRLPSAKIILGDRIVARCGAESATMSAIPLAHGDESLGELVVGLRYGESRLAFADERVLALLAAPIAVALHATGLADELSRSREQTISAREEERRRLRRDLHDGLGPVLTGVVLNAEAALRLVRADPARSEALLGDLRDQTTGALQDIRRLVYELRPPSLDSLGLLGALQEYAMVLSRRADGAPLRVTVEAATPLGDLPAAAEVAAYRIVTEALTNVTRHSTAESAMVSLAVRDGELHAAVHDDGVNAGTGVTPGVGLTSIRERAAELGGRCTIRLDRTGGRIDVWLPAHVGPRPAATAAPATARQKSQENAVPETEPA
jgi:two-component system NarL family sensor kinase